VAPVKRPLSERIATKYVITDDCWLWTGATSPTGYAYIKAEDGKQTYAHRAMYELAVGPIPEGLEIDHLCRVRHCVNPAHLEAVTAQENSRRSGPFRWRAECPEGHQVEGWNRLPAGGCRLCYNARMRRFRARRKVA
jgi:hypothetical protein